MTSLPKSWTQEYKAFCEKNGLNPKLLTSLEKYKNEPTKA